MKGMNSNFCYFNALTSSVIQGLARNGDFIRGLTVLGAHMYKLTLKRTSCLDSYPKKKQFKKTVFLSMHSLSYVGIEFTNFEKYIILY